MPDNQDIDAVFIKPTVPKNSWQILYWLIFEIKLLNEYSNTLSGKQIIRVILQCYPLLFFISLISYFFLSLLIVVFELPLLFPELFKKEIFNIFFEKNIWFKIYLFYIKETAKLLFLRHAITLSIILILDELLEKISNKIFLNDSESVDFVVPISWILTFLLITFLAQGFIIGMVKPSSIRESLFLLITMSLIGLIFFQQFEDFTILNFAAFIVCLKIVWEPLATKICSWKQYSYFGLFEGSKIESFSSCTTDFGVFNTISILLVGTLVLYLIFQIVIFRLIFYPVYYGFSMDFYHAPYLFDASIRLPIWRAKTRLCDLALKTPETALKFVTFLRTYRPLQSKLADNIFHAALAGFWLKNPLQTAVLELPPLIIENASLRPSASWYKQADSVKSEFISYIQQNNISLKQRSCQQLITELTIFKQQTLVENPSWKAYYLKAIELWLKVANEQLEQLKLQALSHEPITANVYLSGDPLNPEMHRAIFLGRDDVKDQFSRKVLTSPQMPMFLIQGQRRTGKTSLLNFLEPLLGAGFRVIKQDLQNSDLKSIPDWLADLQQRISPYLDTRQSTPARSEDWLQSWQAVQSCLSQFNGNSHYKLILAFDEYEAIHTLLQQDPAQGERLLAAMRSFSQSQNKVVFLFVGAALFSELEQPNWSKYFVQAQRFRVDYLKHDDAIRLITEPVKLNYPRAVCEQMFDLTQGHPALLQLLCSKMVDVANTENKKDMSQVDLDAVIQDVSNERETSAILIFWKDFCADPACKQTVKQILNGETIEPNQHLYHLEEHGFIVEQNGRWQMRVPLFAMWLKRFAERVV